MIFLFVKLFQFNSSFAFIVDFPFLQHIENNLFLILLLLKSLSHLGLFDNIFLSSLFLLLIIDIILIWIAKNFILLELLFDHLLQYSIVWELFSELFHRSPCQPFIFRSTKLFDTIRFDVILSA